MEIINNIFAPQGEEGKLSDLEWSVIIDKATELPFSGEFTYFNGVGTYVCRQCGASLYRSKDKFDSPCGWASFDDEIEGSIHRELDADGFRTEILCARCGGHLGHVFEGERYTAKDTRHCVNSVSMRFIPEGGEMPAMPQIETAIFGGGCFWGIEYIMRQEKGVLGAESGYMGGVVRHPSYEQVKMGVTGHAEVVKVVFDPQKVSYRELAILFFEIHDPTQIDRQGSDIGHQYRSVIFYTTETQRDTALELITELRANGYAVVTSVEPADTFWRAEEYHQGYYSINGCEPECVERVKRF